MALHFIDWLIIACFLVFSLLIGLYFRKRASKDLESFFLGGRNMPWFVAGISMVATTFAAVELSRWWNAYHFFLREALAPRGSLNRNRIDRAEIWRPARCHSTRI
ncbi:MAG: hypothetical protein LC664_10515 [Flavobacteriales bacterium]|nr:hypothetical protein [Flavobacteriales bacterium]